MFDRALDARVFCACSCACDSPISPATAAYSEVEVVTEMSLEALP
jgi:hypothetical protein